jgi:uncharacterized membrane protein
MVVEILFYCFAFLLGGTVYQTLELWWRRRTHWTMFLAGGTCAVLLNFFCNDVFFQLPLPFKCLLGAVIITAVEFCFGCVVNLKFQRNVWDYSRMRGNVLGQICPYFSMLWCILSLPAILFLNLLYTVIV